MFYVTGKLVLGESLGQRYAGVVTELATIPKDFMALGGQHFWQGSWSASALSFHMLMDGAGREDIESVVVKSRADLAQAKSVYEMCVKHKRKTGRACEEGCLDHMKAAAGMLLYWTDFVNSFDAAVALVDWD